MKLLFGILITIVTATGCKNATDVSEFNAAVTNSAGMFIKEYAPVGTDLRIKGKTEIKNEGDSIFHVTGKVEGFSPMNSPRSIKDFRETLHYNGGDINDLKNWKCMDLYIDNNKIK